MGGYVEGWVLPVKKDGVEAYLQAARALSKIWIEHGALQCVECVADDTPMGNITSFPRSVQLQEDEVVVLAWITFHSREHRDAVKTKVINDPRSHEIGNQMPVDSKRMFWGGFKTIIEV